MQVLGIGGKDLSMLLEFKVGKGLILAVLFSLFLLL